MTTTPLILSGPFYAAKVFPCHAFVLLIEQFLELAGKF
jgi:hypothetical protein